MSHLYCVFRPPTVISLIFAGEQRPQKKGKCYFGIWVKNINGEEALLRWRWRIIWTWIAVIKPIRTVTREHAELFSEHKAARSVFCKNSLLIGLCYLLFTQTSSLDIQVFSREKVSQTFFRYAIILFPYLTDSPQRSKHPSHAMVPSPLQSYHSC